MYEAFQVFHTYFDPRFGRREARDHSRHYLQALLVQSGERRNAGNVSERGTLCRAGRYRDSHRITWAYDRVTGRSQECLGPRLGHADA